MKFFISLFVFSLFSFLTKGQYVISTITGTNVWGYSGDSGPAIDAQIMWPLDVCADKYGNIYIADNDNERVRKISAPSGIITTFAGNGIWDNIGENIPATDASLRETFGVCADDSGNIYVSCRSVIRKINALGIITTIAGKLDSGGYSGDGGLATNSKLASPIGITTDNLGHLYIVDAGNHLIRKITLATGIITSFVGTTVSGFSGDGGPATNAQLGFIAAVAVDKNGNIYIGDNDRIRKIDITTGIINTIGGTGISGYNGDGGPVTAASIYTPSGLAVDDSGNIYIATGNAIRKVTASTGVINTIAGTIQAGYSGDGGAATAAQLNVPYGLYVTPSGSTVYIADRGNSRIRMLSYPPSEVEQTSMSGSVSIFPNPSTGRFFIKANNKKYTRIIASNSVGHVVYQSAFYDDIDLSGLPGGVYFLHLSSPESTSVQKIVISR